MKPLILGALLTLASLPATSGWFGPSDFNECLLENMKGVSSNSAALAIATACRAKFPLPPPPPPTAEEQAKAEEQQEEQQREMRRNQAVQNEIRRRQQREQYEKNRAIQEVEQCRAEYKKYENAHNWTEVARCNTILTNAGSRLN